MVSPSDGKINALPKFTKPLINQFYYKRHVKSRDCSIVCFHAQLQHVFQFSFCSAALCSASGQEAKHLKTEVANNVITGNRKRNPASSVILIPWLVSLSVNSTDGTVFLYFLVRNNKEWECIASGIQKPRGSLASKTTRVSENTRVPRGYINNLTIARCSLRIIDICCVDLGVQEAVEVVILLKLIRFMS